MRKINLLIGILALFAIVFYSCEDESYDFPGDGQNKVYIKPLDNTVNGSKAFPLSVLWTPLSVEKDIIKFPLYSTLPTSADLTVSVSADTDMIEIYNSQNGTNYEPLPEDAIEFVTKSVVIHANTTVSMDSVIVTVADEALSELSSKEYLVGLKIDQISGEAISSSNRDIVYIKVRVSKDEDNIYDIVPEDIGGELLSEDRSSWTVSCENSNIGSVPNVFDGKENTNSDYEIDVLDDNTGFVIDMKKEYTGISGICYNFHRRLYAVYCIESSDIYTSVDNKEWVYQGHFENSLALANAMFYKPLSARYIKTIVKDYSSAGVYIRELNIYVNN